MPDIVLHHYGLSPFSEKVRLAFGLKGLRWRSVDIAPMPPRPLLEPLTGGYRRAPVLQVGADIYCDSHLILATLERLHPQPTLYPAGSRGVSQALAYGWDRLMWVPMIGVLAHYIGDQLPAEFIRDRKEGYLGFDMSKSAMAPDLPRHRQQVHASLAWLKTSLADGRRFLFGDQPGDLDITCQHMLWLLRANCPADVDTLLGLAPLLGWYDRVRALGHGQPEPMSVEDAFALARGAEPEPPAHVGSDPDGLERGMPVTVTPDDNARVAVQGTLVASDAEEVVIRRRDAEAGELQIHFPRAGYDVVPA